MYLQGGRHGLAILVGHEVQRMPQQVHNAGLHRGVGEDSPDRFWEALEPVHDGHQDVLGAAVLQFIHHP